VNAKPSPTDPTLAQVEVARDPELMREIFQRHLRSLGEETYQVRECRISRAHYLNTSHMFRSLGATGSPPATLAPS